MNLASGEARSSNYLHQLKGSFVLKLLSVGTSFLMVPIALSYLGPEQFGVWSVLLSVVSWIVFFDLGIGSGLRNMLAASRVSGTQSDQNRLVSNAYSAVALIAVTLLCLTVPIVILVPWQSFFNTASASEGELKSVVAVLAFFVCLNFWASLANSVLNALQRTSIVVLGQFLASALTLVLVAGLHFAASRSLYLMATAYGIAILVSTLIVSTILFRREIDLIPHFRMNREVLEPMLVIGSQFFLIQVAYLLIFTTNRILIAQFFGPTDVAIFEVVFKFFSVITVFHSLISTPLIAAYTEAYARNELSWIRKTISRQLAIFLGLLSITSLMGAYGGQLLQVWIGNEIEAPRSLIWLMAAFTAISCWNAVFGTVLGGIGTVRLGAIYTPAAALINIPLGYYFGVHQELGVTGILLGTVIAIGVSAIVNPLQVWYFIYTDRNSVRLTALLR